VTLWAEDEHRLGLLPVGRRVWAPVGQRPTTHVRRRFQWVYVYGFVRPASGESWWCLLPTVRTDAFALALAEFARDEGSDATHRAVLVLDQAGWHHATTLRIPAGIDLIFLPAYSPELQPAERLWPLVNEAIANQAIATIAQLEHALAARCQTLRAARTAVQAHTQFHWWPAEPAPIDN
jgi:hypothetical protein